MENAQLTGLVWVFGVALAAIIAAVAFIWHRKRGVPFPPE
jgi:hypothetical protein